MSLDRNDRGPRGGTVLAAAVPDGERPLTARSVVASLLLGMRPPRLAGSRLVRWCGVFGISEGTARVALHRMVERGELTVADGVYELAGRVRARQPVQDFALAPRLDDWAGDWLLALVAPGRRPAADRLALRDAMRRLRLAELREGCWARPANLPRAAGPPDAWDVADAQCAWWRATPHDDPRRLAAGLFAPAEWARRARRLERRVRVAIEALADPRPGDLAEAFAAGAAALAHVRADPLLPPALLPDDWPGDALRDAYREYQPAFGAAVRDWFRQEA